MLCDPVRLAVATVALALVACGGSPAVTATATPHASSSVSAVTGGPSPDAHILSVLQQAWAGYKQALIQPDGRVIDPTRNGITTSEGQSYALLRAVWMGDRTTFDNVWHWTETNLKVRGDGLFASLWGLGGVQDHNTASDADSDIALALLYAGRRFNDASYLSLGHATVSALWQVDVVAISGMNVMTGGNWAAQQQSPGPVINPSYFAPYAYRTFAREDSAHPWLTVVDSSYTLLDRCTSATLDGVVSAGLPPNWCAIDRSTGTIVGFPQISGASQYGYDAFRVMWRVAVDAIWNGEQRARDYLSRHDFLRKRWQTAQRLDPVYGHDGTVVASYDDPTVYGGDIGSFLLSDASATAAIEQRLLSSFHTDSPAHFGDANNYFEQNWVWFGLALSSSALTNLDGG